MIKWSKRYSTTFTWCGIVLKYRILNCVNLTINTMYGIVRYSTTGTLCYRIININFNSINHTLIRNCSTCIIFKRRLNWTNRTIISNPNRLITTIITRKCWVNSFYISIYSNSLTSWIVSKCWVYQLNRLTGCNV